MKTENATRKVQVNVKGNIYFIDTDRVIFLKAAGEGALVTELDHKTWPIALPIDELEQELKHFHFWRTDNDHLINLNYLKRIPSMEGAVFLKSIDYSIPVEKKRLKMLVDALSEL
ncbi:MAG: LytTR family transcriptional regulator DNA-binding domain-containing protein [Prolixibacteraceae bacterium]|nr:LytTR family transcriptional regulator DNA-binding domain-containing protein [Prolixibacteraceae bacterium]